ncbi:GNAT family N-acetyltransferase [Alphaproteobacteria bacterium]|nr:GNAT family N-acetyltransferase [Alphaproteobacteria bacterium]
MAMGRIELFESLSDSLLSHLQTKANSFSLYHSNHWAEVLHAGFRVSRSAIISFDGNDNILAFTPIFVKQKFGLSFVGSPLPGTFTEHAGPIFLQTLPLRDRVLIFEQHVALLKGLTKLHAEIGFYYKNSPDNQKFEAVLEKYGFKYYVRPSLVLNLNLGCDKLWRNMESRARGAIRKAEKNGLVCTIEDFGEYWTWYHELVTQTFSRQKKAMPHPAASYEALAENLSANGKLFFFTARLNESVLSAGIFLIDDDRMVFHSGSSTEDAGKFGASSLVQWGAIEKGIQLGLNEYDFGGVGIKAIDKFKKSFGGAYVEHHRWVYRHPLFDKSFGLALFLRDKGFLRLN